MILKSAFAGHMIGSELARCATCSPRTPFFWSVKVRTADVTEDSVTSFKERSVADRTTSPIVKETSQKRKAWERPAPLLGVYSAGRRSQ